MMCSSRLLYYQVAPEYFHLCEHSSRTELQDYPRPQCCYSLRGYIRGGAEQNYRLFDRNNLPPVRYILPIPRQVNLLSPGREGYANYYGY